MSSNEEIKIKISTEYDLNHGCKFSDELKKEIEKDPELKKFSDDLMKIGSFLGTIGGKDILKEPDIEKIKEKIGVEISKPSRDDDTGIENILAEPFPETAEEKESCETIIEEEGDFSSLTKTSSVEEEIMRLSCVNIKAGMATKDESGKIDLKALLEKHRKSVPPERVEKSLIEGGVQKAEKSPVGRYAMVSLIVIFAVIGIWAVWKISVLTQGKKEKTDIATNLSTKSGEGSAIIEKAHSPSSTEKAVIGNEQLSASEQEKTEKALVVQESSHHLAKRKEKSSGSISADKIASVGGTSENRGSEAKETSSKQEGLKTGTTALLDLIDSATAKKEKPAQQEKQTGSSSEGSKIPGVDELMGTGKTKEKAETESSGLPATLNKNEIREIMKKLNPQIQKCGEGKIGTLILNLVVSNDGTVKSAKTTGQFASDPAGKCAENAAMGIKFPPFKNPTMNVTYPYVFAPPPGT